MTKKSLLRLGYAIKRTGPVGWWVDGAFGFLVTGYWASEAEAVARAAAAIALARQTGTRPAWLMNR